MVPCKKFNLVFFASLIMKNSVVSSFSSRAKLPVKLICYIAFGSALNAYCNNNVVLLFIIFFKIIIVQQSVSCIIISLISCIVLRSF